MNNCLLNFKIALALKMRLNNLKLVVFIYLGLLYVFILSQEKDSIMFPSFYISCVVSVLFRE